MIAPYRTLPITHNHGTPSLFNILTEIMIAPSLLTILTEIIISPLYLIVIPGIVARITNFTFYKVNFFVLSINSKKRKVRSANKSWLFMFRVCHATMRYPAAGVAAEIPVIRDS